MLYQLIEKTQNVDSKRERPKIIDVIQYGNADAEALVELCENQLHPVLSDSLNEDDLMYPEFTFYGVNYGDDDIEPVLHLFLVFMKANLDYKVLTILSFDANYNELRHILANIIMNSGTAVEKVVVINHNTRNVSIFFTERSELDN